MTPDSSERAISTAIDATFALLLISASVTLLVISLDTEQDTDQSEFDEADQLVETLNALKLSTNVSVRNTLSGDVVYTYPREGTAVALLAEAAISESEINGVQYMSTNYARGIRGKILNYLSQTGTNAQIRAVWEPSEHAPVRGEVIIGPEPPADEDISTATLTVPSGLRGADSVDLEYYAATANNPPDDAVIAAHIIQGYFPPLHSQYLLEQDSSSREDIEYRYKRAAHLMYRYGNATGADASAVDEQFQSDGNPRALILNNILITMLKKDIQLDSATQRGDIDPDLTVDIKVRTW